MSIPQFLVKVIDYFLTEKQRASAESTMRTRMIVCYFLFQSSLNIFGFLSLIKFLALKEIMMTWAFLCAALFCLFLIRKDFAPEKIAASYLTTVLVFVCLRLLGTRASSPVDFYLTNSFNFNLATSLLILPSSRMRRNMILLFLLGNGICYWYFFTHLAGDLVSFHSRLIVPTALIYPVYFLILVAMILKIRSIAQNEIDQEIEWQQRNLKLKELSAMARTLRLLFDPPIHAFQKDIETLKKGYSTSARNRMQGDLDELILISQSFSWIYRAYRHEKFSSIPSTTLLRQIQTLLSSKMKEEGWTFDTFHAGQPVEVHGPIPSLVLFLFTVILQIVEAPQPQGKKQLSMEMGHEGQSLFWKVYWPSGAAVSERKSPSTQGGEALSKMALRQELIRELIQICDAEMQEFQEQSARHILIRIPWRRLDSAGAPLFG